MWFSSASFALPLRAAEGANATVTLLSLSKYRRHSRACTLLAVQQDGSTFASQHALQVQSAHAESRAASHTSSSQHALQVESVHAERAHRQSHTLRARSARSPQ